MANEKTITVNGNTVQITSKRRDGTLSTVVETIAPTKEAALERYTVAFDQRASELSTFEAAERAGRRAATKAVKKHLGAMDADAMLARLLLSAYPENASGN